MLFLSRVHVSQITYELIKDSYEVEEGHGGERCEYLKNINTYLIKGPKASIIEKRDLMFKKDVRCFCKFVFRM